MGKTGETFMEHLANANNDANPRAHAARAETRYRGWQDNCHGDAHRVADHQCGPASPKQAIHTRVPSRSPRALTIKDRLRVLQPNDPDSYYASRDLVPRDMLEEVNRAKIVITNYHAFKLRERVDLSKGGRSLLQGRGDDTSIPSKPKARCSSGSCRT